jgi:lipoprotein NlpI
VRIPIVAIGLVAIALATPAWPQFVDEAQKCFDASAKSPDLTIRFCTNALESGRTSPEGQATAYANRGWAHQAKGQLEQAIQDYSQSLRIKPGNARLHLNRGIAYLNRGEDDRALEDLNEVLRLTPKEASAYYHRGLIAWRRGQVDQALRDYDEALRLNPQLGGAHGARGDVYRARGDRARALDEYDQALRLNPGDQNAHVGRGLTRFDQGQLVEAIPDLARAVELDPKAVVPALYLYLAREHLRQNARPALAGVARGDLARWPGPVVAMFLGRRKPEEVLAAASAGGGPLERARLCQAYFYVGHEMLFRGESDEAVRLFKAAVATDAAGLDEYESARAQLKRLEATGERRPNLQRPIRPGSPKP